jgi:predicted RNA-binding Zn ribbon-like protein
MRFGRYTDRSVALAVDLVNTFGTRLVQPDLLDSAESLRRFLLAHGEREPLRITRRDLLEVRAVRDRLGAIFDASDEQAAAGLLNEMLLDVDARPQVTDHDDAGWHLHFTSAGDSWARGLAGATAASLALVLCDEGLRRMGRCAAEGCQRAFVDLSRNRARRFCSVACADRTNVAAYRKRSKHARSSIEGQPRKTRS